MNKLRFILLAMALAASPASAQFTVPHTFSAGQLIDATKFNANFDEIEVKALNRTGGTITGVIAVDAGITIDGVDLSAVLGGTGNPVFNSIVTGTLATTGLATLNSLVVTNAATVGGTLGVTGAISGNANSAFSTAVAGSNFFDIRSTNGGSTTLMALRVGNDAAANAGLMVTTSTGFTPGGAFLADAFVVASNQSGGLSIGAHHASGAIRFYSGGQSLRATIDNAGLFTLTGSITSAGTVNSTTERLTGAISPPQIAADINNYNPTGLSTARIIRIDTSGGDGDHNLTGLVAQPAGTVLSITVTAGQLIVLQESGSSSAANRFGFLAVINPATGAGGGITIWYDGTSSRWRQIG